ncbi:unnamed protein product, partial [Symbiodinium pilosum]
KAGIPLAEISTSQEAGYLLVSHLAHARLAEGPRAGGAARVLQLLDRMAARGACWCCSGRCPGHPQDGASRTGSLDGWPYWLDFWIAGLTVHTELGNMWEGAQRDVLPGRGLHQPSGPRPHDTWHLQPGRFSGGGFGATRAVESSLPY